MEPSIKNLSIEEKIALVEELLEEIEMERNVQQSEAQLYHIQSGVRDYETNPEKGKSWDELKSKYFISKDQKELLDKRRASHLKNPNEGITLEQFIAKYSS